MTSTFSGLSIKKSILSKFYHYFLDKVYEVKESPTDQDKTVYEFIKRAD